MTSLYEQFIAEMEAFLAETGMSPTALGIEALKDPNFVFQVRQGRAPGICIVDKVLRFMAKRREAALLSTSTEQT